MTGLLAGAVALVTGGASGLGRAIALRFAEEGARAIVVADLQSDPLEGGRSTVELVTELGAEAVFVRTDVTRSDDVGQAVAAADRFGGVTAVVTSAGILRNAPLFEMTEADFDRIMAINVKGTFLVAQAAARSMMDGGRKGSIVLVSSIGGVRASGLNVPYATSKGAVNLMGFALGDALAPHGIRVNVLQPGVMNTAMTKGVGLEELGWKVALDRAGDPREVANGAVFLASPLASYITSTALLADGGIANLVK